VALRIASLECSPTAKYGINGMPPPPASL